MTDKPHAGRDAARPHLPSGSKACYGCGAAEDLFNCIGKTLPTAVPVGLWRQANGAIVPASLEVTVRGQPYVSTFLPRPLHAHQAIDVDTVRPFMIDTYYCDDCGHNDEMSCLTCQCGCENERPPGAHEYMLYVEKLDGPTRHQLRPAFYNRDCITRRCASCRVLMHNDFDDTLRSEFSMLYSGLVKPTKGALAKTDLTCPMICVHCVRPCVVRPEERDSTGLHKHMSMHDTKLVSDADHQTLGPHAKGACKICNPRGVVDDDDDDNANQPARKLPQPKRRQTEAD